MDMTPAERASCLVRIWRCPGYAVNGNLYPCHPDEEPGGYDVGFLMIMLNQKPMTLDAANLLAGQMRKMLEYALEKYDPAEPFVPEHAQPFPMTEEWMFTKPTRYDLPALRALAKGDGRLVWTPRRRGFVANGSDLRMPRDTVFYFERQDLVRREPGSDRLTGDRLLTERARAHVERT
jgi:hypothetical protein